MYKLVDEFTLIALSSMRPAVNIRQTSVFLFTNNFKGFYLSVQRNLLPVINKLLGFTVLVPEPV